MIYNLHCHRKHNGSVKGEISETSSQFHSLPLMGYGLLNPHQQLRLDRIPIQHFVSKASRSVNHVNFLVILVLLHTI